MKFTLKHSEMGIYGAFGGLFDEGGNELFVTLEHAYYEPQRGYFTKIPNGQFQCIRGLHRLDGMMHDFETFEVTGVSGHTGLLFHWGNYNCDSEGCILLGEKIEEINNEKVICNSRVSFNKFMALLNQVNEFTLSVESSSNQIKYSM